MQIAKVGHINLSTGHICLGPRLDATWLPTGLAGPAPVCQPAGEVHANPAWISYGATFVLRVLSKFSIKMKYFIFLLLIIHDHIFG